jgi:hypothetical protein
MHSLSQRLGRELCDGYPAGLSKSQHGTWRLLTPYARHPCVSRLYLDTDMPLRAQFVLLQASTVPVEGIHRAFRTGMGDRWIIRERFELMLPFLLRATVPDKGSRIGPGMSGLSSLVSH